jgi:GrpB-like predicted nucleotidyltransferase (UPF0157 family)
VEKMAAAIDPGLHRNRARKIRVLDYNPEWADHFCQLRERVWPYVRDIAIRIEHVGSTAVPGLAAKPVIDLDIVIPSRSDMPGVIARLGRLGYEHRGNLGIEDREAFRTAGNQPAHNLYACHEDSLALRNHIALRDHLRTNSADVVAYSSLKKELAERCAGDIDCYVEGKTEFILSILARSGFDGDQLDVIRRANRNGVI